MSDQLIYESNNANNNLSEYLFISNIAIRESVLVNEFIRNFEYLGLNLRVLIKTKKRMIDIDL
ncbi:MAG: hypothetical protein ABII27_05050 [bacterium]